MKVSPVKTFQQLLMASGVLVIMYGMSQSALAAPLAGNIISNMAIGEYKEEGSTVVQTSRSNLVQTTIIPVYSFTLTANRSIQAVAGQTIRLNHELTNTGNSTDRYNLSAANLTGDNFEYSNLRVYLDANRDGVPDGAAISSYSLSAGESVGLVVTGDIPASGVSTGNNGQLRLSATSTTNSQVANNTDTATISDKAVLILRKAFSVSSANLNDVITVRLDYENRGSIATGLVDLTDVLNSAQLVYQAGGENWNGLALNPATGSNDPAGINYSVSSNTVSASLSSIPANSSGYIQFNVTVAQASAGRIPNTVSLSYDHDNNTGTANLTDNSNTAILNVKSLYGVEINGIAASASAALVDNLVVAPAVSSGGEVSFRNYVWNTGNSEDRFNLTFTSDGFPAPHQIEFYRADSVTPLLDSNGDGIPDTGILQAGQKLDIVVKARFPTTLADTVTTNYSVFPQAQSIGDSTKTNTVEDRTSLILTNNARLVDLLNSPETTANGSGNGAIDNSGNAWKTLSTNSGGTVTFPLGVKHTGTPTSYSFSADADGDFSKLELPAGVESIRYFATSNNCSTLGEEIGQTRLLNDGEEQVYCAVLQLKTLTATASNIPVYFKVASATYTSSNNASNPGFDTIKNAFSISSLNSAGTINLTPNLRGQIAPSGTVVYTHILQNATAANLGSAYHFVSSNDKAGFTNTLYYDANDNGIFDSTDPQINNLGSLPGGVLAANSQIRIFDKVQSLTANTPGVVNTTQIILQDGANATVTSANDVTTLATTQIRLTKLQAKDDNCDGNADGAYTSTGLVIGRNANGSGQCVLYQLIVRNQGAVAIGSFTFHDETPAATVMAVAASCANCTSGTVTAPTIGQSGSLSGTLPAVNSGASHTFEFGVRYVGR